MQMLYQLDHNGEQQHPTSPLPKIYLKIISLGKEKQEVLTFGMSSPSWVKLPDNPKPAPYAAGQPAEPMTSQTLTNAVEPFV